MQISLVQEYKSPHISLIMHHLSHGENKLLSVSS